VIILTISDFTDLINFRNAEKAVSILPHEANQNRSTTSKHTLW